jgi:hypothetical protein
MLLCFINLWYLRASMPPHATRLLDQCGFGMTLPRLRVFTARLPAPTRSTTPPRSLCEMWMHVCGQSVHFKTTMSFLSSTSLEILSMIRDPSSQRANKEWFTHDLCHGDWQLHVGSGNLRDRGWQIRVGDQDRPDGDWKVYAGSHNLIAVTPAVNTHALAVCSQSSLNCSLPLFYWRRL